MHPPLMATRRSRSRRNLPLGYQIYTTRRSCSYYRSTPARVGMVHNDVPNLAGCGFQRRLLSSCLSMLQVHFMFILYDISLYTYDNEVYAVHLYNVTVLFSELPSSSCHSLLFEFLLPCILCSYPPTRSEYMGGKRRCAMSAKAPALAS